LETAGVLFPTEQLRRDEESPDRAEDDQRVFGLVRRISRDGVDATDDAEERSETGIADHRLRDDVATRLRRERLHVCRRGGVDERSEHGTPDRADDRRATEGEPEDRASCHSAQGTTLRGTARGS